MKRLALVSLLAACGAGSDANEHATVQVGDIALAPPDGWPMQELGTTTRVWEPTDNPRKETVTVIIGRPIVGRADAAFDATRTALGLLNGARVSGETSLTTPSGLVGHRFDLQFRPSAGGPLYDRSHAVLLVGDHSVHILYTAAESDPERTVLSRVIASVRKGG